MTFKLLTLSVASFALFAACAQAKHAVGQQAKIPRPSGFNDALRLDAILNIMPHGCAIIVIHARIHRKAQPLALGLQRLINRAEIAKCLVRVVL